MGRAFYLVLLEHETMNIKRNKAKRISCLDPYGCARYPRTWDAILARIPDDIWQALTARQIAALAEIMRGPTNDI
jgi:hypothetical protein